ncbi:polycomb protein Pcl [Malaya genurostris]|uniref:polycomb protein Pcl n=1 Tax=Malaya genurostris TaxID=325434 RepID=UPI0026F3E993|nr:polycomb protein Pcl [Malaya genurostris]
MSTGSNGEQFLMPNSLSSASSIAQSQLYRHPGAMVDNAVLSIKSAAASAIAVPGTDVYHYKEPGDRQTKQQIIIQEFLNSSHTGSYGINHHQQQQIHPPTGSGNGSPSSTMNNNSSIMILTSHQNSSPPASGLDANKRSTVVLDRINICINNHFNEPTPMTGSEGGGTNSLKPASSEKRSSTDLEPDSTTSSLGQLPVTPEKNRTEFKLQEDVLVEHKDGRFYLGTIIAIGNSQCLVRFNDNTECWSDFRELTKLSCNETDDSPACVVCKQHSSPENVEVCENCGRGYHIKCMDGNFERNGYWFCRMCTSPNGKRKDIRYVCSGVLSESLDPLTDKSQLPYNIDSLTWDAQHLTNTEQHYCYCGDDGNWLREMIQCCRCQQWYHGRCIRSLQYPIFLGDRFYFFICSICNHGHEFVRRLEISWPDLIHLALYNLIARNGKRFYDVTKAIASYVEDNWKTLQMPEHMVKLSPNARKEIFTQTLTNDRMRFKCANEGSTLWSLRIPQPPSPPNVFLLPGQIITEHILTQMSKENRVYRFLPRVALEKSFVNDAVSREKMTGVNYCSPLVSEDDVSEMSDGTNPEENSSEFEAATGAGIGEQLPTPRGEGFELSTVADPARLNSVAIYASTGKNSSSSLSDSLFSSNAKDGFQFGPCVGGAGSKPQSETGSTVSGSGNRRAFKSRPKKTESDKSLDIYDSSDDTSRNTLIIPHPKDFSGKNNPFYQPAAAAAAITGSTAAGTGITKSNETKDLTQKASTSNPNHISNNLVSGELRVARIVKRRLSARDIINGSKYKRRKFRNCSVIGTTLTTIPTSSTAVPVLGQSSTLIASLFSQPVDSSGWTSQVAHSQLLPSSSSSGSSTPPSCSHSTNIQPNMMVPQQTAALALPIAPSTANSSSSSSAASLQMVPNTQSSSKRIPAHGRRLRQRQERNYAESSRRSSVAFPGVTTMAPDPLNQAISEPASPCKTSGPLIGPTPAESNGTDLQSSLNLYFGAAHRILSGEKFAIKGKRVSLSGKVQYLIEWEGCPAPVM